MQGVPSGTFRVADMNFGWDVQMILLGQMPMKNKGGKRQEWKSRGRQADTCERDEGGREGGRERTG
jgi:hypothetical protein